MRRGLTGRSTTGVFVVVSGNRLYGPFDGRGPADRFRRDLAAQGYTGGVEPVWSVADARQAIEAATARSVEQIERFWTVTP